MHAPPCVLHVQILTYRIYDPDLCLPSAIKCLTFRLVSSFSRHSLATSFVHKLRVLSEFLPPEHSQAMEDTRFMTTGFAQSQGQKSL